MIPDWREVSKTVPPEFVDNGSTVPLWRVWALVLKRLVFVFMDEAGRLHDYGYGPGRLPGSPWADVTREEWDQMYRQCLDDHGCRKLGGLHYFFLRRCGEPAWRHNWVQMQAWEWTDYAAFVEDPDKGYHLEMGVLA